MSADELRSSFADLGVDVDEESLRECVRVCAEHGVEADTLVEAWLAYSLSALGGAEPTAEKVRQLERKEFGEETRAAPSLAAGAGAVARVLPVYGVGAAREADEHDVISNYLSTTPKRIKQELSQTASQVAVELSPATYSPNVSHSAKYASRKNAGLVVFTYGDESALKSMDKPWNPSNIPDLTVNQIPNEDGAILGNKAMFGFDLPHDKAGLFDNHIRYLSQCIMKKAGIKQITSVRCKSQVEVFVAGRVECDADARLNPQSVVLQGTWEESLGQAVPLDLQQCPQYSLFPGLVVVARGTNPRGDRFLVHEIYSDAALPLAPLLTTHPGTLNMLVASGPYTPSDSMAYEPLKDFVSYAQEHKPHVVIMTGPFLDADHPMVKDNSMAETYRSFFEKLLDNLAEINAVSPHTRVVAVASARDSFHENVYPTPAPRARRARAGVTLLPDPCCLSVAGLSVAVTSTDVLMHLAQEEISLGCPGDKLGRLASHVLSQQCMYPLWPAPAALPCDTGLWAAHAQLPHTPHLLLLPTNLRYVAKDVNGCLVVNPERLTKGAGGGTFARLEVQLGDSAAPVAQRVSCQIVRI